MMPIENWAYVQGKIKQIEKSPINSYISVTISIDIIKPVDDYPNLLHREVGDEIFIYVPDSSMSEYDIKQEDILSARVRRADLYHVYAHPDYIEIAPFS
jgi:hypothetical protein